MADIPETKYADGGGGRVAYQLIGDGPVRVVVPSGGFPVDLIWDNPNFVKFLDGLSEFSTHVWFDLRGRGASEPVELPDTPSMEVVSDDVLTILDACGWQRAALLGTSESARNAAVFAASHPDSVSALILINTFARMQRDDDYPWGTAEEDLEATLVAVEAAWGKGEVNGTAFAPTAAHDPEFRRWAARSERMLANPRQIVKLVRNNWGTDIRPILSAIHTPTLVLHRASDCRIPAEHGRYLAEHIPNAKYVEVPGEDHLFFMGDIRPVIDEIEAFLTGHRPQVAIDRVLATVLFTDIVSSTLYASQVGDRRWVSLLDRYNAVADREIRRFRGKQIKTTGDGTLATFDGPGRAISCARVLRDAVRDFGMELRAGLHTGEVELHGNDIAGIAVHIGARIAASAGSCEILVSSTVKDLVAGSGIEFDDRGEHELKGVPGARRLFAVEG